MTIFFVVLGVIISISCFINICLAALNKDWPQAIFWLLVLRGVTVSKEVEIEVK
jgi:hypothetical protein